MEQAEPIRPETEADEQRLVEANMPLVYAIAKRYAGRGVDPEDLRQLGAIGLLKAIRRFDPMYGVCFSTYAVPLIAGEIKRFLRDDGMIRFSRSVKELSLALHRLMQEHPDLPLSEAARILNVSETDIAAAMASGIAPRSLDEPDPLTGDAFGNAIPAPQQESASDNRLYLQDLMHVLDEREKTILELRYRQDRTQSEVGAVLGISQVQVSRLEKRILQKLRSATGE